MNKIEKLYAEASGGKWDARWLAIAEVRQADEADSNIKTRCRKYRRAISERCKIHQAGGLMAQLTAQLRIVLINNLKRVHDIESLMELNAEIHELMVEKQLEIERKEMRT